MWAWSQPRALLLQANLITNQTRVRRFVLRNNSLIGWFNHNSEIHLNLEVQVGKKWRLATKLQMPAGGNTINFTEIPSEMNSHSQNFGLALMNELVSQPKLYWSEHYLIIYM